MTRTGRTLAAVVALLLGGAADAKPKIKVGSSGGPPPKITVGGDRERPIPEEYIVEEGDTLWDISDHFYGEPWRWPTLWALNPHVTNPHWIYPGDVLRLRLGEQINVVADVLQPVSYTIGAQTAAQVSLNEGFIAEKEMDRVGRLAYSAEHREYLAQNDLVYLTFKDLDKVRIGDQYSVFRVLNDVVHPETEEVLGRKIQVMGVVEVNGMNENVARARILRSFHEIERGMYLTPLLDHYRVVSPRQNLIDLGGTIVDALLEIKELGQFNLVFVDRGAKDGVQVGNRFFVMRRGDGFLQLAREEDRKLPWEQIGEALVVETRDRTSTAVLTRAALEVRRGDRVVMERHY